MKPPPQTKQALYVLYFFSRGLASADDVVRYASLLDEQELEHYKLVAGISYYGATLAKVLPVISRL